MHVDDFNPRTPCGVRRWASRSSDLPRQYFNPRTPCGVRPCAAACRRRRGPDFNPRTPCGVRRWIRLLLPGTTNFNPRAPCGARLPPALVGCLADLFQSTRPVWGATSSAMPSTRTMMISIHAPRVGRDKRNDKQRHHCKNFNPRAPCGARRRLRAVHAGPHTHFNPRAPCGARPKIVAFYGLNDEFQSTRPVWGATIAGWFFLLNPEPISIHAPRVGRDQGFYFL